MPAGSRKTQRIISSSGKLKSAHTYCRQVLKLVLRRLDYGGGKDLSLPECPREQLEKEVSALWH